MFSQKYVSFIQESNAVGYMHVIFTIKMTLSYTTHQKITVQVTHRDEFGNNISETRIQNSLGSLILEEEFQLTK